MGRRKERNQEKCINGRRVVGASEAAQRLTERARALGYDREYSRDTIYLHYTSGRLIPVLQANSGNLYYLDDIDALPMSPQIGKPGRKKAGEDVPNPSVTLGKLCEGKGTEELGGGNVLMLS